jgi:uncharacterized protein (DUF1499 family)
VPMIHDVTTDLDDPPQFVALRDTRLKCPNGVAYSGLRDRLEQHRRHKNIVPFTVDLERRRVFAKALEAANAMGWKIAAADIEEGRIEAVATTLLMRFRDDIVIRVRNDDGIESRSRVDIRSASRVGRSDFGANAKRIRLFFENLITLLKSNT